MAHKCKGCVWSRQVSENKVLLPQGKLCKRKSISERDRYVRAGAVRSSAERI